MFLQLTKEHRHISLNNPHTSLISHCFCFMPMSSSLVSSRISSRVRWWVSPLWCRVWEREIKRQRCKNSLNPSRLHLHLWITVWQALITVMLQRASFHCGEPLDLTKIPDTMPVKTSSKMTLIMRISHISVTFQNSTVKRKRFLKDKEIAGDQERGKLLSYMWLTQMYILKVIILDILSWALVYVWLTPKNHMTTSLETDKNQWDLKWIHLWHKNGITIYIRSNSALCISCAWCLFHVTYSEIGPKD